MIKNLPEVQEAWVQSLGWEDPLEEGMATHSSILAWRIPMDRGAWRAAVYGSQRVGQNWVTKPTQHIHQTEYAVFDLYTVNIVTLVDAWKSHMHWYKILINLFELE